MTGMYPWKNKEAKILPGDTPLIINENQFAFKIMLVTHFDGIGRIESYYIAVFHVNRRDTVIGFCNQARIAMQYVIG